MAKQTFTPVPLAAMQTNMGDPGFTALTAGDLGTDGTAADGFDAILGGIAQAISDEGGFIPTLDVFIGAMDFAPGTLIANTLDPLIFDFASFLGTGNSIAATINAAIQNGVQAPPPVAVPVVTTKPIVTPPVSGGGAGVSVGTVGGEPPWFDPHNPQTWGDASGGGPMIPDPPWLMRTD